MPERGWLQSRPGRLLLLLLLTAAAFALILYGQTGPVNQNLLWQHRNLAKAFYENPTTQKQAVDEFEKALALAPDSAREHLNLGLALLRAGEMDKGVAELERVQKQDPSLPHTWFNLGITYKKQGDFDKAFAQFQGMAKLAPDDPTCHYQLGAIYKSRGETADAIREFEKARDLNPRLAAPHFQLYGLFRQNERTAEAAKGAGDFSAPEERAGRRGGSGGHGVELLLGDLRSGGRAEGAGAVASGVSRGEDCRRIRRGQRRADGVDARWREPAQPDCVVGAARGAVPGRAHAGGELGAGGHCATWCSSRPAISITTGCRTCAW